MTCRECLALILPAARTEAQIVAYCQSLGNRDDLFAEDLAATARCPDAIDVRVACGGTGSNYNYTETEPGPA